MHLYPFFNGWTASCLSIRLKCESLFHGQCREKVSQLPIGHGSTVQTDSFAQTLRITPGFTPKGPVPVSGFTSRGQVDAVLHFPQGHGGNIDSYGRRHNGCATASRKTKP